MTLFATRSAGTTAALAGVAMAALALGNYLVGPPDRAQAPAARRLHGGG